MKTLQRSIKAIENAGFSHIKVELEAQLDRGEGDGHCYECEGNGMETCDACDGEGAVEEQQLVGQVYRDNWVECDQCSGDGEVSCSYCEGSGNTESDFDDEGVCEEFIRDHVSQEARNVLTYGNFYNDGSVDSEFTFTVPASKAHTITEWINAFTLLAESVGNGMDVEGAGMHISLIPTGSRGRYPSEVALDSVKIRNFKSENQKLLPALFFLASADHRSRGLDYRKPLIGTHKHGGVNQSYPAICTHGDTCLEYRVFETCYDRPEAIFDYLEVIANTLKFYTNPELKVKPIGAQFGFNDGNILARMYDTPEQLRILNAQISQLKPKNKTIKQLKSERGICGTITEITKKQSKRMMALRQEYKEMQAQREELLKQPFTPDELREIDYLMLHAQCSRDAAEARVRNIRPLPTLRDFINNNIAQTEYRTFVRV